jgi:hypothetical protein
MLAGPVAVAQSTRPAPVVAASPAPSVPWCPPGQAKDAAGRCVTLAAGPSAGVQKVPETPTVYQTVNGVRTPIAGGGAPAPAVKVTAIPTAKPAAYAKPAPAAPATVIAAAPPPMNIAVGEPNGDCTSRAPNLIHDSRSPGGCAPCPRGYVPNLARQACVIPIPRRY